MREIEHQRERDIGREEGGKNKKKIKQVLCLVKQAKKDDIAIIFFSISALSLSGVLVMVSKIRLIVTFGA